MYKHFIDSPVYGIVRHSTEWFYMFSDWSEEYYINNGPTREDFADRVNHTLCFEGFEDLV